MLPTNVSNIIASSRRVNAGLIQIVVITKVVIFNYFPTRVSLKIQTMKCTIFVAVQPHNFVCMCCNFVTYKK